MTLSMGEILKELGWSDGFHIPAANEENKKLEQEVEEKMNLKATYAARLAEVSERVEALSEHLRNMEQAHQQNQGLLTAQYAQLQTEEHLARLARNEHGRLGQELRQLDKASAEIGERHAALQKDVARYTDKLEKLKASVKWDVDARLAWDEAVVRGEDDNLVILRAIREDDSEAKERELERQRLTEDVRARERLLAEAEERAREMRRVLDHTAELFRKTHAERRDLLAQWEDSVRALHRRDQDIYCAVQELGELQERAKEREAEREERRQFLDNEVNNNKELEARAEQGARTAARLREELATLRADVALLAGEEQKMQRTIAQTGHQLNDQLRANAQLRQDIARKRDNAARTKAANEELRRRLDEVAGSSSSAADRVRQLEEMIQVEERTGRVLEQDVARLGEARLRTQAELSALRRAGDALQVDLKGCELAKDSLRARSRDLSHELQRHKEVTYNLDFECQKLESRLARLSGQGPPEDQEANQRKIAELEETLALKTSTLNLVKTQIARLENMERQLSARLGADGEELARLEGRLLELRAAREGGQRQLRQRREAAQARQVEENLLRLRVRQAEAAVAREGDRVYDLERYRLEMEAAMKERQVEIAAQKDVMLARRRGLAEERSRLLREQAEWREKIAQLHGRYELTVSTFGQSEDGAQLSVTQVMLKNAQEKYELQQHGDRLDAQIQRAEKEILALENTLKVVNAANDTYKKSLSPVDEDGPEMRRKAELEAQLAEATEKLRLHRTQLQDLRTTVTDMEGSLAEVEQAEQRAREQFARKQQERDELEAVLREQQVKMERAARQVRRATQELRGHAAGPPTLEERDIETRELQEQNQTALQHLALVAGLHLETAPVIKRYLADRGLALPAPRPAPPEPRAVPSPPSGGRSSACSSARSTVSPSVVTLDAARLEDSCCSTDSESKPEGFGRESDSISDH
ncbi:coiled-coil domain-containing protein 39 [Bacillus rossius redtenbacheri]|uniref:coiled-coil domain-containing protein 39 n=1 Tax=Bacillus rossius redtenbacheri TaxID=93214 RepID=UPI002FDDCCA0